RSGMAALRRRQRVGAGRVGGGREGGRARPRGEDRKSGGKGRGLAGGGGAGGQGRPGHGLGARIGRGHVVVEVVGGEGGGERAACGRRRRRGADDEVVQTRDADGQGGRAGLPALGGGQGVGPGRISRGRERGRARPRG